ncbi:MAG: tetratricopeptide repeat protein [Acidobacteriota bacterium]
MSERPLTAADAMAHVCRAYHPEAKLPDQEAELSAIYNSVLNGKRALLIMDNAKDRAQVEPLIPPAGCALIVTSRQHFTLPGLFEKDLDALPVDDARELLLKIAKRIGDHADEIARLCGCLPLALRVAASAIAERKNLSPADYVRRLSDEKQRLSHLKEVDVALSVSCAMLGEERFALWRKLAVFPSTFDDGAAAVVWEMEADVAEDALGDLLAYSLLEYDEEIVRYRLHDLARIFVDRRLSEGERDGAKRRHAVHYCRVLEQADETYLQGGDAVTRGLALFDWERENIEAGWGWAAANAQRDEQASQLGLSYPNAGVYVLHLRQHLQERIKWLEVMLEAARRLKHRGAEGYALGNLGIVYFALGEPRKAIEYHEEGLAIAREIGNREGEGMALGNLGLAYLGLGETRRAIEYHEQRLAIARETGERRAEGRALGNLGNAYCDLGETHKAIEYHEQNLVIARETGDRIGEGSALGNLGNAYASLGQTRKAIDYFEEVLVIALETGDRDSEAHALGNIGKAYDKLGETRKAIKFHEQALTLVREIGTRLGEAHVLSNLSLTLYRLGERGQAVANGEAALRIFEEIESPEAEKVRTQLAEWRAAPQQ